MKQEPYSYPSRIRTKAQFDDLTYFLILGEADILATFFLTCFEQTTVSRKVKGLDDRGDNELKSKMRSIFCRQMILLFECLTTEWVV